MTSKIYSSGPLNWTRHHAQNFLRIRNWFLVLIFNLIFAERLEKLDKLLLLNRSDVRQDMKGKIRNELNDALGKENLIYEEDKILLYKLYQKLKKEFQNLDKSKI